MKDTEMLLQDDGGFLNLFELSKKVVKRQTEIVEKMERHITKYGYEPPHKPAVKPTKENGTFYFVYVNMLQVFLIFTFLLTIKVCYR